MTRTLSAGLQAAVAAQRGTLTYFIRIDSSGGTSYLCTAPVSLDWDSHTWEGIGGAITLGAVEESTDPAAQSLELTMSGVDQSIIAIVLTNHVRGQELEVWRAYVAADGTITDVLQLFLGYQQADYRITEERPRGGAGTATVRTRVVGRLAALRGPGTVKTNVVSHNDMLERAGLPTGDTFFQHVGNVANRTIAWGDRR